MTLFDETNSPVPFDSPAVERGAGLFETVLLVGRRAALWQPHVKRLRETLERMELPAPPAEEILAAARRAVEAGVPRDDEAERALRFAWIAIRSNLDDVGSWRLDASVRAIPDTTHRRRLGSNAVTVPFELCRDTPRVKSTSYFAALAGLRFATRRGGDEGLFVSPRGAYLEGTSTALVAWRDGHRLVPETGALPSVTLAAFLDGAGERGEVTGKDLLSGSLLLGSLTKAAPIATLDGASCAMPEKMLERITEFNVRLTTDPFWLTEL